MEEKPKSVMDVLKSKADESTADWEWNCSDELRKVLENMGLYDEMREQVKVISTSKKVYEINIAKSKLDALGKTITILKNSAAVYSSTGAEDDEQGFSKIEITMHKTDGPEKK